MQLNGKVQEKLKIDSLTQPHSFFYRKIKLQIAEIKEKIFKLDFDDFARLVDLTTTPTTVWKCRNWL